MKYCPTKWPTPGNLRRKSYTPRCRTYPESTTLGGLPAGGSRVPVDSARSTAYSLKSRPRAETPRSPPPAFPRIAIPTGIGAENSSSESSPTAIGPRISNVAGSSAFAIELAPRRMRRAAIQVQHLMPTTQPDPAQLHLKRMAGIVVDENSHVDDSRRMVPGPRELTARNQTAEGTGAVRPLVIGLIAELNQAGRPPPHQIAADARP